jgi:flagellar protein FlaG
MQINSLTPSLEFPSSARPQKDFAVDQKEQQAKTTIPENPVEKTANIEKLKNVMAEHNVTLKFSQDKDTKEIVVELVDDKTGEAIRQIPSQISLKLAAIFVKMQGQFVDKQE